MRASSPAALGVILWGQGGKELGLLHNPLQSISRTTTTHPLHQGEQSLKPTNTLELSTFTDCPEESLKQIPGTLSPQSTPCGREGTASKGRPSQPALFKHLPQRMPAGSSRQPIWATSLVSTMTVECDGPAALQESAREPCQGCWLWIIAQGRKLWPWLPWRCWQSLCPSVVDSLP